jgi:hypothetical protein
MLRPYMTIEYSELALHDPGMLKNPFYRCYDSILKINGLYCSDEINYIFTD